MDWRSDRLCNLICGCLVKGVCVAMCSSYVQSIGCIARYVCVMLNHTKSC